jgi:hypothetical protein
MNTLRFTLLAEGTSDRVLIPILTWMLMREHPGYDWIGQTADLQALPRPPRGLPDKIAIASELFPADVIFIHRDADREAPERRRSEIEAAIHARPQSSVNQWAPVVPVRMTEAWLLVSEPALRAAAGNPNGRVPLCFPSLRDIEAIADPKYLLHKLLIEASETSGRRRKKFSFPVHRARVPDFIDEWEILLRLPSAKALCDDIAALGFA